MHSLKVATRLNLLILVLTVLLLVLGGLGLLGISQSNQALESVYQDRTLPITQIAEIQQKSLRNRLNIAMAIANPTPANIASEIAKVEENIAAITKVWAAYTAHPQSPAVAVLVERFAAVRKPFVEQGLKPALAALRAGDLPETTRLAVEKVGPLYQPMDATIQELTALYLEESAKEYAAALGRYERIRAMAIVAVLGGVLLAVLLGNFIVRSIARELGAEPRDAAEVARAVADGRLTTVIRTAPGDGSSLMAQLQKMQASLVAVVGQVRSNSESVASASEQIAQGNNDLAHRTEEQASALQQTAASMEQLSSTVQQNTDNALQANQLAQSATTVAIHGGKVVGQVVDTMKGINDSSKQISDIIGVIDGIAFQTNILALNAAVEAARAGEQGRGFAVVASEVRSLAGRSADAAKEIAGLISASVERVAQGTALVDQAGQTMQEVVASIQRVTDIMRTISAASQEQSVGMAAVGTAVAHIDETTQQNAALVEESAAAADSLKVQAQQLVDVVAVFQLDTESTSAAPRSTARTAAVPVARLHQLASVKLTA